MKYNVKLFLCLSTMQTKDILNSKSKWWWIATVPALPWSAWRNLQSEFFTYCIILMYLFSTEGTSIKTGTSLNQETKTKVLEKSQDTDLGITWDGQSKTQINYRGIQKQWTVIFCQAKWYKLARLPKRKWNWHPTERFL